MTKRGILAALMLAALTLSPLPLHCRDYDGKSMDVPVKGMATLVDLGAKSCIPCKMMDPILQKMDRRYEGKAAVVFIDVRYYPEQARRFGIQGIPSQIFFDRDGREVYRHTGFMSESQIVAQFKRMGID
jgi:thioredoxin 1